MHASLHLIPIVPADLQLLSTSVVIVGSGPAAHTAAIYTGRAELETIMFEVCASTSVSNTWRMSLHLLLLPCHTPSAHVLRSTLPPSPYDLLPAPSTFFANLS